MTAWTRQELDRLGAAEELEITTARRDGSLRRTPIWVVRLGDDLYVRSYRGADGAWYRRTTGQAGARINAAGIERDVAVDPAPEATLPAVDDAYRSKYARYADDYLPPMLAAPAVDATLRLRPAD